MKRYWPIVVLVLVSLLAACAPATPAVQTVEVEKTVVETVEVEKTVVETVEVEKTIVETVEVEKEKEVVVTATPQVGPKHGGTFHIALEANPNGWDPQIISNLWSQTIYEQVYEGLVRWDESEQELLPSLATEWDLSDDELVYTFKIRQGVKFHNGREMTADDVKANLDRMRDAESGSTSAPFLAVVVSVEVLDPETVQVTLSEPSITFLSLMTPTRGGIAPPELFDDLVNHPVGTGPFVFDEYVVDDHVRLVRNPDYWDDDLPYLDAIDFKIITDPASREAALRSQAVDMTKFKEPRQWAAIALQEPGLVATPNTAAANISIRYNMCKPPFDDVRVRRAVSLALDRQKLMAAIVPPEYGGELCVYLPPHIPFAWPNQGDVLDAPYFRRDVEKAKELLAEAGYPDGLTIAEYKVNGSVPSEVDLAQAMKQQLAEAGIDITITPLEVGQLVDDLLSGNFEALQLGGGWLPDAHLYFFGVTYSTTNWSQTLCTSSPETDALIDQGSSTTDFDTRSEVYHEIETIYADQELVGMAYCYPTGWYLTADKVKGFAPAPSSSLWSLRATWLDE